MSEQTKPQELFKKIAKLRPDRFETSVFLDEQFLDVKGGISSFYSTKLTIDDIIEITEIIERQISVSRNPVAKLLEVEIYDMNDELIAEFDFRGKQHSAYYAGLCKIIQLLEEEKK